MEEDKKHLGARRRKNDKKCDKTASKNETALSLRATMYFKVEYAQPEFNYVDELETS